jgi:cell division protein FtsW (lipid II flippase)
VTTTTKDRLGTILALLFVGILWAQRDYTTPMGGIFPDRIMLILVALLLATLILSFTPYRALREEGKKAEAGEPRNWMDLFVVIMMLMLWTTLQRYLGFALLGVLGFAGMSWYLGGRYRDIRAAGVCLAIGVAVTALFILVFGYFLKVPLPAGTLFD